MEKAEVHRSLMEVLKVNNLIHEVFISRNTECWNLMGMWPVDQTEEYDEEVEARADNGYEVGDQ